MPTAVLRRYTPPTCTLEIAATGSALSRWTDRQVMKNVRFDLHFDDPRTADEHQVSLWGDRTQLDALCEAVENYVQQLLDPDALDRQPVLRQLMPHRHSLSASDPQRDPFAPPTTLQNGTVIALPIKPTEHPNQGIVLTPRGLLSHDLHLGTLANDQAGTTLRLSTTQLFDLANALDSYAEEALILPELGRPAWTRDSGRWLKLAAGLVFTVGATVTLAQFLTGINAPQVATTSAPEAGGTPLTVPNGAIAPAAPNRDLLAPPTPPAGALSPVPPPFPTPLPNGKQPPLQPVLPPPGAQQAPLLVPPPAGVASRPLPNQRPSVVIPPPVATVPSAPVARRPIPPAPTQMPVAPITSESAGTTATIPDLAQVPASGGGTLGGEPTLPAPENSVAAARQGDAGAATLAAPAPAMTPQPNLPAIPQVRQVRDYFQEQWRSQPGIDQTLEYRLVLAPDGSIEQILPLTEISGANVDRTGMPLTNEPFVEPIEGRRRALVRVVLSPDGQVQTFLEGLE